MDEEAHAEQVYRLINTKTGHYVPAPRNTMGVYATLRGARAGKTQYAKYLRGNRRESIEDYEVVPYVLMPQADFDDLIAELEKLTAFVNGVADGD